MRSPNVTPPTSFERKTGHGNTLSAPLAIPAREPVRHGSFSSFGNEPISFPSSADGRDIGGSFSNYASSDPGEDPHPASRAAKSIFFPLECCACLPATVRGLFPSTWQKIQDWTHLSLLIGVIGAMILMGQVLFQVIGEKKCHTNCVEEVLVGISTVPCGWYILKMIGTYDEQIQEKERLIAERKKELSASYDSLIGSMDDLLGKAAESSATMAERSFESKRRDFQRFLERAETRYTQIAGTKIDTEMMLQQFRRFVQRWLVVFEECSVDPIRSPKRVVTEEELNRCRTIGDVASLTLERLKATEVRFISSQRDKDAKMLKGFRAQIRRITTTEKKAPEVAAPGQEIELSMTSRRTHHNASPSPSFDFAQDEESGNQRGAGSFEKWQAKQRELDKRCCACEWFQLGAFGCGYQAARENLGYPRVFQCICFRFVMLSRMHFMLMIGLLCSVGIVLVEVAAGPKHLLLTVVGGAAGFGICLLVVLVRFEQIDIIQRLEREVNELAAESDRIVERKEQMVNFWNSMQQLTDLWVHRTVPRLDLLKEVQGHLEDAPPEDVLALMAGANTRLEDLENHLPELSLWEHHDNSTAPELTEDSKKGFAERIERLCHEEKLPKILHGINKVIEERILCIEGQGAPQPGIKQITSGGTSFERQQRETQSGPQGLSFSESRFAPRSH